MLADIPSLSQCRVLDETGQASLLGAQWAKESALLIFLRHFACIACRGHASEVWAARTQLLNNVGHIVFVGNGSATYIKRFREDLGLGEAAIFTDPSLISFRMAGFQRGFLASHGPASLGHGLKLLLRGHMQMMPSKEAGDLWQLGGSLMIDPSGAVLHHYISEALGDFAPAQDLEEELQKNK